MQDLRNIKNEVVGKTLINLFHTPLGEGFTHLQGLGKAYYFRTVIQIDNGKKFDFGFDWIMEWNKDELLTEINHQNWGINPKLEFKNQKIKEIIIDVYGELIIRLDNDVIIYQGNDNGVSLHVHAYSEIFNSDGTMID